MHCGGAVTDPHTASREHAGVINALHANRRLAHQVLFAHRHSLETPDYHGTLIDSFHGPKPQVVIEAFRGGGKSTIGEEAVIIGALLRDFENCVLVGSTEPRAIERLEAIKHELATNEDIVRVFGTQKGPIWQAHKIVLPNDVCIQAMGVGQAVLGIKHHAARPDLVWADDVEDDESVRTPEACRARLRWLMGILFPVCAKLSRKRVSGNRRAAEAVVAQLAVNKHWVAHRFPISHIDFDTGREVATWPALFDMKWIADKRDELESLGMGQEWASEYMCEVINEHTRSFRPEEAKTVPRVRTWEYTQAMFDPAKTSKNLRQQSHYGKAVWSWIGNKLVVWKCNAQPLKPDELIADVFATDREFNCGMIGVELDGLEEWLMQPLRIEQTKRGVLLPQLQGVRAPRDKDSFIKALAPFVNSGEIEFAEECPEARAQLMNFPSGRKDALNALAYALKLRPGSPVYEGFNHECVAEEVGITHQTKRYLCLAADGTYVTGALCQFDGTLSICADWIEQGDAGQCVENICRQAAISGAGQFSVVVSPREYEQHANKGLVAALRRLPRQPHPGSNPDKGRAVIRDLLSRRSAIPKLIVSAEASWTLRAFAGGYCKDQYGAIVPGAYTTLMEGLETFAAIMHNSDAEELAEGMTTRMSRDGRMYRSVMGDGKAQTPTKAEFLLRAR